MSIGRLGITLAALLLLGTGVAVAQVSPPVGPSNFGSISVLNASIGDTFATAYAASSNPLYDFADVYTFTYTGPGGSASGSAISFSSMTDSSISNLQAAVFALPTSVVLSANNFGTYGSSQGDTMGALNPWTTLNLGTGSATTFSNDQLVNGMSYAVEVRGLIGSAGASYGGTLTISSVPEPTTLALLIPGMLGLAVATRRRRRAGPAH
jgi:hypothetical protein